MSLTVGDEVPARRVTVDASAMKVMAVLMRDPNPIHWDVDVLRALGLDERPVNQGPSNLAYVWDALTAWTGSVAAVLSVEVRFVSNALAGEVLAAGAQVTAVDDGVVTCEMWLRHEGGEPVLEGMATVDPAAFVRGRRDQ
ncbi:MAG: protein dehydratase [Aeromicrobium sp.]|jgi:acyl dehydratase|nr:protein dehydratase [Aeromicrobium sp.]